MRTDEEQLQDLQSLLTNKITDVEGYIKSVTGKKAREELKRFTRQMQDGDELWEYAWTGRIGLRHSYSAGWCVVRHKHVVASYCAHSS